jgi:hypothetical protein
MVLGNTALFQKGVVSRGGKADIVRGGFVIPESKKTEIEAIQIQIKKTKIDSETKIPIETIITKKLIDECEIKLITDPTPEQTIKRVGRNYLGEDLSKYIVVSMPNDTYLPMETEIRQAKDIQLGDLPDQNMDGSYSHQDGMLTIIPPDPPTEEELEKEQAEKDRKINLANAINAIKSRPTNPTQEEKTNIVYDYIVNTIGQ